MKNLSVIPVLCLVSLLFAGTFALAGSRTVEDYYHALPAEYFSCEMNWTDSREARERAVSRANVPAGYILARSEGYPLEVALFLGENRKPFVAVSRQCGQGCMCNFFRVLVPSADGGWHDATRDVIPLGEIADMPDVDARYQLPEKGTTIRIVEYPSKKLLAELVWTKKKFVFRRAR